MSHERLEEMLSRAGGFRREGQALAARCPRCGKDKLRFRLHVPKDHAAAAARNGIQYRFTCYSGSCSGWDGKPEFALAEMLGCTVGAARAELYGRADRLAGNVQLLDDPFLETEELVTTTPDQPRQWPHYFLPLRHPGAALGLAYLEGRGVPLEIAEEYGIRYSVIDRSVAFPVEQDGVLYGWQTRLCIPHEWIDADGVPRSSNKTSTSSDLQRTRWMFGDRMRRSEHAFVLEGPVDAVKAHLVGGNAASMGKVLTPALVRALAAYPWRKLYVGLDADAGEEVRRLVAEFDQAMRWPGREVWQVDWPKKTCGKCGGSGRDGERICKRCDGGGREQMDAGALTFAEVFDLWRAARRAHAEQLYCLASLS